MRQNCRLTLRSDGGAWEPREKLMKGMGQGREIREGFPEVVTLGWAPKKSGCELREETEVDTCAKSLRQEGGWGGGPGGGQGPQGREGTLVHQRQGQRSGSGLTLWALSGRR